ncbi:MAG: DUF1353 domain-containing protein [Helicobacter sp.]|uniref:DUF1353 domain-containing protein n=1 Tax=Helicobacter sp. TaxID=218 RepID=UPI0023CA46DC|nr:DUF1353 domain-containing protein [Helicobacter sp.]MDE5926589.1 DUF1353 domain-containing protein [Helicobacter sp.]MDE7175758.1 DUF1353 domain-containing protein [Helicobacter sp.]
MNKELRTILRQGKDFEILEPFRFYFRGDCEALRNIPSNSEILQLDEFKGELFIEVPKGFKTDFGSVPQLFQSLLSPVGKPTKAYVLHDYLCELAQEGHLKRKVADDVFLSALRILGIGKIQRVVIYASVRFYALCFKPILNLIKRRNNG